MSRIEDALGRALRGFAIALLLGIVVLMVTSVINRFFPLGSMDWSDEIIELLLVWLVFTGAAELWRRKQHFFVEVVPHAIERTRARRPYRIAIALACLAFIAIFTYQSFDLFMRADDTSPFFSLPRRLWYGAMPLNGFLMTLFSLRDVAEAVADDARPSPAAPGG